MKTINFIIMYVLFMQLSFSQESVLVSIENSNAYIIYQLNVNGGSNKIFDFSNQPYDQSGGIWHLRSSSDQKNVLFSSDNAHFYTISRRNIFRIGQNKMSQLTPGPNSGQNVLPNTPTGTIKGKIMDSAGYPYGGGTIWIEGMEIKTSDAFGEYTIENVPEGLRWITGYRPASLVFNSIPVSVVANLTTEIVLIPDSESKINFEMPYQFKNHIYFRDDLFSIVRMDLNGDHKEVIYKNNDFTIINGFDVAHDGTVLIADLQYETNQHRGLYTCNANGGNLQLLFDFKGDQNWGPIGQVFWSPDKSKIAMVTSYNTILYILVIDAQTGNTLGTGEFGQHYSLHNVTLHGWNQNGTSLLYSDWLDDPYQGRLSKVPVTADGSIDVNNIVNLVENQNIGGACWINTNISTDVDNFKNSTTHFQINPNPTNGLITVTFEQINMGNVSIQIFDMNGRKVKSKIHYIIHKGKQSVNIDCSELPKGQYITHLYVGKKLMGKSPWIKS